MYTNPSAIFLSQISGYTDIFLCKNINYGQLKDSPAEYIQEIMNKSCNSVQFNQIMQVQEGIPLYVIQREKMFSLIDYNNKMITCTSNLPSIYDSREFNNQNFISSMTLVYQDVCSSIYEPQLRSKLYCEKEGGNNYNYDIIDRIWKESCPTSYKILPISPYNKFAGMVISIYQDNSNEYKVQLGHLYNSTTLLTAPALSLRENFQNNDLLKIQDIESLRPFEATHKLPHIIFSDHSYDSCNSGIHILTPTAERHHYLDNNSKALETFFYYNNDTINKREEFLNNLYVEIFNQDVPNNPDGCMLSKSTYQSDQLIENYFDDITSLARAKRESSLKNSDSLDNNYSPSNLLTTHNPQTHSTESYDVETTQSSNFFTNISNSLMNTFNSYFTEIIGASSIITTVLGGVAGWKIAHNQAQKLAIANIIGNAANIVTNAANIVTNAANMGDQTSTTQMLTGSEEQNTGFIGKTTDFMDKITDTP